MPRTIFKGMRTHEVLDCSEHLRRIGELRHPRDRFDGLLEATVIRFQITRGLGVDGAVGPETWGALQRAERLDPPLFPFDALPPLEHGGSTSGRASLDQAIQFMVCGCREEGQNNAGIWIDFLFEGEGKSSGAWCAATVKKAVGDAYQIRGWGAPPLKVSTWCPSLWARMEDFLVEVPEPGDIWMEMRNASDGRRPGHTGFFHHDEGDGEHWWSCEGNKGSFPTDIRPLRRRYDDPDLLGFARLPDPPGVAVALSDG